ncbi:hypothetical protein T484DRAFT_2946044 [Baffinella frigidus]|nr:hypothetical protein T484DRAFT_2946044 [Cryptophyta sp. CCMP2293]
MNLTTLCISVIMSLLAFYLLWPTSGDKSSGIADCCMMLFAIGAAAFCIKDPFDMLKTPTYSFGAMALFTAGPRGRRFLMSEVPL